jgi:DNA helicase-2/ATP-dependent DNA helicase PcrA
LLDVDPALLTYDAPPRDALVREARDYVAARSLMLTHAGDARMLPAGARVRHRVFGTGSILSVDADRGSYAIQFDEMDTPRSISTRSKLERL